MKKIREHIPFQSQLDNCMPFLTNKSKNGIKDSMVGDFEVTQVVKIIKLIKKH